MENSTASANPVAIRRRESRILSRTSRSESSFGSSLSTDQGDGRLSIATRRAATSQASSSARPGMGARLRAASALASLRANRGLPKLVAFSWPKPDKSDVGGEGIRACISPAMSCDILRRIVHLALDRNHVVLIAAIDQQLGAPPRTWQRNLDHAFDATGRAAHDEYAVGQEHRFVHAMGDEHDGLAVTLPDLEQLVLQPRAGESIKRSEWLVHQQDTGAISERARDRHALLHAARQFLGVEILVAVEVQMRDQGARARKGFPPGNAVLDEPVAHIAEHGLPGKQGEFLEYRSAIRARAVHLLADHAHAARRWRDKAADHVKQRRLPAAGGADNGDELPLFHGHADLGEGKVPPPFGGIERFRQLLDLDAGSHLCGSPWRLDHALAADGAAVHLIFEAL